MGLKRATTPELESALRVAFEPLRRSGGFRLWKRVQVWAGWNLVLFAMAVGVAGPFLGGLTLSAAEAASDLAISLPLPPRPLGAEGGSVLAGKWAALDREARDREAEREILRGNVPSFLRRLVPLSVGGGVELRVSADYLAVGGDDDWMWMPMGPEAAQRIADRLGCRLPTARMVDAIYRAADLRLEPRPMTPGPDMISVGAFARHSGLVRTQLWEALRSTGVIERGTRLVAGHKKDVVVTERLRDVTNRVAIYGWHRTNGVPIQPLYLGHATSWVDYSHGIRLVSDTVRMDGRDVPMSAVAEVVAKSGSEGARIWQELGGAGVESYPTSAVAVTSVARAAALGALGLTNGVGRGGAEGRSGVQRDLARPLPLASAGPDEQFQWVDLGPGVRAMASVPRETPSATEQAAGVRLVLYALPNGNTIEQTVGRRTSGRAGADAGATGAGADAWRYEIQHVAAQTRWLRAADPGHRWVVVYLEAEGLAWPAWRRRFTNSSERIVAMVDRLSSTFLPGPGGPPAGSVVLSGHSGGGSWIIGYVNGVRDIPDRIGRIAFLDANYAYDPALGHAGTFVRWLGGATNRFLTVLAYDDARALLDGRPFVSAAGGTWGRSHLMLTNLMEQVAFEQRVWDQGWFGDDAIGESGANGANGPGVAGVAPGTLRLHRALGGRLQLWLRENPERKILHTVQVERNGFIHALVAGTEREGRGYRYLGPRAYERWILPAP